MGVLAAELTELPPPPSLDALPRAWEAVRLADVRPEYVPFLWEGKIPANLLSIVGGYGGTGKSTLMLWIAAHVTRGTLPGDLEGTPRNVVIVSPEDDLATTTVPRLKANNADMDRCFSFFPKEPDAEGNLVEARFSLPGHLGKVRELIEEYRPALILLDPITAPMNGKEDDAQDVRLLLDPLNRLAMQYGCTLVGIKHSRKGGGKAGEMLAGSKDWHAAARSVLMVAADGDTGFSVLSSVKLNSGMQDPNSYRFTFENTQVDEDAEGRAITAGKIVGLEVSDTSYEDVINRLPVSEDEKNEALDSAEWLAAYLEQHGDTPVTQVIKDGKRELGVTDRTLRRAAKKLEVRTDRKEFQGPYTWSLPLVDTDPSEEETGVQLDEETPTNRRDANDSPRWTLGGHGGANVHLVSTKGNPSDTNEKSMPELLGGHEDLLPPSSVQHVSGFICPIHEIELEGDMLCGQCLQ